MRASRERLLQVALMAMALTVAFVLLMDQVEQTAAAQACLARAQYEPVPCPDAPPWFLIPGLAGILVAISVLIGRYLGRWSDER